MITAHTTTTDWQEMFISDCVMPFEVERGKKVLAREYKSAGKFPIVDQGQQLVAGYADDESAVIRDELPLVVFGDHTRVFKFVDFPFVVGADGTKLLRPKSELDPKFFYFACLSLDIPTRGYNRHFKILREQTIRYPEKFEQEKIAAVLWKIQKAVEIEDAIVRNARDLKKSLLRRLFTHGLRSEPLKETEIGPLPESWEVGKLNDFASVITKGSSPRWQGFEYCSDGVLFVRSQNVGWGRLALQDKAYLPVSFNQKETRSILKEGDVLINLVGASIGRVALATKEIEGANTNQAVCLVRLNSPKLQNRFLVHYLLTDAGQFQIHHNSKDIARANISLTDVRQFQVAIPRADEQRELADILQTADQHIDIRESKKRSLQELFKTMLQKLMTAQIRVNDLDIDTSEVNA